jgi:hypothetical protein
MIILSDVMSIFIPYYSLIIINDIETVLVQYNFVLLLVFQK